MQIHLVCVGGPFDGKMMPRPDDGPELAIPHFLLQHSETFGTMTEELLSSDDARAGENRVGDLVAKYGHELVGGPATASLYRIQGESLVFVRTLSNAEYREWKSRQPRDD